MLATTCNNKVTENKAGAYAETKMHSNILKVQIQYEAKDLHALARLVTRTTPIFTEGKLERLIKKSNFPFGLTVEDLGTKTATTSWISSARVGAPCPLRKSGPCSPGGGISRCPKSLFVSRGRSYALWARGGAETVSSGSAASTNVWAPSYSRRLRRRWPRTQSPLYRRRGPSSLPS